METKANYTVVGIFTLVIFAAAFAFIYWIARGGAGAETAELDVVIDGSVIGLGVGSPVYFNGVIVGKVTSLRFDQEKSSIVIARSMVRTDLPITNETKAILGYTGLTGIAHIELEGGDVTLPTVFEIADSVGEVAVMKGDPSAYANLLITAEDIFARTNSVLGEIEGFVGQARGPLTDTLKNTAQITEAIAKNTEKVEVFMTGMGDLGATLDGVSGGLTDVLAGANGLIAAVKPTDVEAIVADVRGFTGNLNVVSEDIKTAGQDVSALTKSLADTAPRISATFDKVDALIASVPPEDIAKAVKGFATAGDTIGAVSENLKNVVTNTDELIASLKPEDVVAIVANVKTLTNNLSAVSEDLKGVGTTVATLAESFGETGPQINKTLTKVDELLAAVPTEDVSKAVQGFADAGEAVGLAAKDVRELTSTFSAQKENVESIVANAKEMVERLNGSSVRVDGVLAKVDGFLGEGNTDNLMADVSKTLASFRQVADTLNSRLDGITAGLEKFSGRGLQDVDALVNETRRSINRIESAISSLESNPQRLLFGGEGDVKRFDGRQRR